MMTVLQISQIAAPILFVVVGVGVFGWFKILKETNSLLREQNTELKTENANWQKKHEENVKQLATMQGQIDVLKSIPLVDIGTTLKEIVKFNKSLADSNKKILNHLKITAGIAAEDRDVLTNQNKHIATEVDKRMDKRFK